MAKERSPHSSTLAARGPAAATLLITLALAASGSIADVRQEGSVRFFANAKSDFDRWTKRPSRAQQAWMREHYDRMLTYSPYFDSRLAWYPNAWVYKDSYALRSNWQIFKDNPHWVLRDADGEALYIPFACSGGSCPQHAADFGNQDFRQWWIDGLRKKLDRGYIGVYIDDVNLDWRVSNGRGEHVKPIDPRTGEEMTLSDWRRYFAEFMEQIRAAFVDAEIVHNVIWYATPADDPFIARQIASADYINLERGATDDGIRGGSGKYGFESFLGFIDRIHAGGRNVILDDDDSDTLAERDYELAAYLLVNDGSDLIGADGDRRRMNPDNFWEGYEIALGSAAGPRFSVGGILRRDFECGVALLNQPDMPTRTVTIGEGFNTLAGIPVRSVVLVARTGAILTRQDCSSTAAPVRPD